MDVRFESNSHELTGTLTKATDDGIKVKKLTLTDLCICNPFGTGYSRRHVDKNLICVDNLDFDNKAFPRWKAQMWIFVLNESSKRLICIRLDCSMRLGSFMLKLSQIKCMQFYEMK